MTTAYNPGRTAERELSSGRTAALAGTRDMLPLVATATPEATREPVFRRDGDAFVPAAVAAYPWGQELLHGGPVSGLLARAIERENVEAGGASMQIARFTVDLFRGVPMAPLHTTTRELRRGRRIAVIEATLHAGDVEVSRATGLLLLPSEAEPSVDEPPPPGPDERTAGPGFPAVSMKTGFHSAVDVSWSHALDGSPAAWFRMPMPFIEGEETTPFVRAAALSDFGNGLASPETPQDPTGGSVNTDISLHMHRPPRGEWICLRVDHLSQRDGIGAIEVVHYDEAGRYGRSVQARLANPR